MIGKASILRRDASAQGTLRIGAGALLALLSAALPVAAWANCTSVGTTVTCDSTPPNPYTSTIGTGPSTASGTMVTLGPNAQVVVGNANAISLGNNAAIDIGSGALVKNAAFSTRGLYGAGGNTIELNSNGTLTVQAGATVYSAGPISNAEAVGALGVGNIIDNYGTIRADHAAVFFSDTFSGSNTIINEVGGLIQGPSTTASVIGTYASTVNFTNMGSVIGSLSFSGRNDQLHLYTGSSVTGSISDGGGADALTLNGTGSGTLTSAISNFETLTKQDVGTWTLTGLISSGGTLPLAITIQDGTLVLAGANTYAGGTTLSGGMLMVGNNSALGTGPLSMAPGTTLSFLNTGNFVVPNKISVAGDPNFAPPSGTTQALTGTISDGSAPGTLNMQGPGTLVLTGANTYSGGTTLSGGTLTVGNNRALGTGPLSIAAGTTLSFLNNFTFVGNNISIAGDPNFAPPGGTIQILTGVISDGSAPGTLTMQGPGALVLEGNNRYTGGTTVNAGSLSIDGDQTAATGPTTVAGGATLGGTGTIGGNVNVASGGSLAPGPAGGGTGTLTVNGNLSLASGSILHYVLGEQTVGGALNDLTMVKGNLTLAGTLNVAVNPDGVFEPGIYRIISYNGALTNNGLAVGTLPSGSTAVVQTSLPGEVNLVNTTGLTVNSWDGALIASKNNGRLEGGSGTWNSGSGANDNWTNATGAVNAPWTNGAFAVFEAVPGTVTVDNSLGQVAASGLDVASNGYLITGGALTLVETVAGSGATEIRVGNGTAAGAGMTATIGSVLQGSTQLVKLDLGTLVLTGLNTYSGGTAINEGVLQVANDSNLGAASGGLSFNGGTLATTASFTSGRAVTLNPGGGIFVVASATTLLLNGTIGGAGGLTKADTGALTLTGTNTYGGGTTIIAGTLQLGNGGTSGSIVGDVADNGTLAFDRSDTVAFPGVISGMGAVAQIGSGTTILTANNPYTGGTTVSAGTLVVGDPVDPSAALSGGGPITVASGATLGGYGSVTGSITNSGTVAAGNGTPGFGTAPAGTFTIIGYLLNQGIVNLASDPIVGNVLEVQGNYVGNGGRMNVNTVLGSDNSPSDKLVITGGTATGNTSVHVTNAGGAGAETLSNGIPIVQAINGATTVPGAFTLAGEVRAGDVTYDLFRGGVGGSDPNDWFLRSSFEVLPPGVPPGLLPVLVQLPPGELSLLAQLPPGELSQLAALPPGVVPPGLPPGVASLLAELPPGALSLLAELPPGELSQLAALPEISATRFPTDPPPATLPPGIYPIVGPELATDGVVQPIARQLGLTMLGTLHERIGDTLTVENAGADAEGWGRSGWARFFGQQIDNRYQSFVEPSVTGRLFGVQAGFDILRASFVPGHRDAAGVYFAYGNSAMDVNGLVTNAAATGYVFTRTGTVNLYGYSGGAYWTHYGPSGWYIDTVLQGTVYNGNATTQFANLPANGSGIITSLEVGYPIPLSFAPRFILEPQGQIIWQYTSFRQAFDGLGEVGLGSTSGATGRLSLRAEDTIVAQNGTVWQPYVHANLWQNWGGSATTTFGVDQVPLLQESTQLEFAAGLTTKINDVFSFYVQAGYMFGIGGDTDGGKRQGVKGDIGVRLTFGAPRPPRPASVAVPAAAARSYLVFFDWDKSTLTDRARQIIREAAANSTHIQYTRIEVNGYTDTSGTPRYNMGLSLRRAHAVAGELVRDGVPERAISIQGFGETHLLVPTSTGVREPQNRRVEIILD